MWLRIDSHCKRFMVIQKEKFEINKEIQDTIEAQFLDITHMYDCNKIVISLDGELVGEIMYSPQIAKEIFSDTRTNHKAILKEDGSLEIIKAVSIHTHTGYSLLDGGIRIDDLVKTVPYACAITDHGNMYGTLDFYKKMKAAGKRPIVGMEAYTDNVDESKGNNHLIILAKDEVGFKNLIKLSSEGSTRKHHGKPHLTLSMLKRYHKGLIVTSACIGGEIPRLLLNNEWDKAVALAQTYKNLWGDDFYLEIQNHGIKQEAELNQKLVELGAKLGIKLVAAADSHYLNAEDSEVHEVLLCIGTKRSIYDKKRFRFEGDGYHFYSEAEFERRFKDYPEALDSTVEITEKCNLELKLNDFHMPSFDVPEGFGNTDDYFVYLAHKGFQERFKGTEKDCAEYRERLEFEINTILKMGFSGYFLIVSDFICYAKNNNIPVGPGRGSACGSLVAYCLRITELDPIPLGLLFERFLNPDRISMPDIDVDFADEKREMVIDYVKEKYGQNAVSKIVTFGTLAARAAIKDVGRVLGLEASVVNSITKTVPAEPKITIQRALEESEEFAAFYRSSAEYKKMIDIAMKLEGLPRNTSVHACGLLIAPSDVSDYIPQTTITNDDGITEIATQYNMVECEEMGILKMDVRLVR